MKQFKTIFMFEYLENVKSKVFLAITIIAVAAIGIALSIPTITKAIDKGSDTDNTAEGTSISENAEEIVVVDKTGAYADASLFEAAALGNYTYTIKPDGDIKALKKQLNDEKIAAIIDVKSLNEVTLYQKQMSMSGTLESGLSSFFDTQYKTQVMAEKGLSGDDISQVMSPVKLNMEETGKGFWESYALSYALIMLLYMSVLLYGQMVATSVAGEKSSRAMELLITTARPTNLMFGKVLGAGMAGLTQIAVLIAAALGFYRLNAGAWGENSMISSIFNSAAKPLMYMIIFYLLGFFLYAFLFGAIGSLASRVEDINTTIMPVMILFIIGFFISFNALTGSAETTLVKVSSFIPFFTPMVMFSRITMTDVPAWEIWTSIALTFITTGFVGYLSAKIYRVGVLMYGKPPKLTELFKILKEQKNY